MLEVMLKDIVGKPRLLEYLLAEIIERKNQAMLILFPEYGYLDYTPCPLLPPALSPFSLTLLCRTPAHSPKPTSSLLPHASSCSLVTLSLLPLFLHSLCVLFENIP